MSKFKGTKFKGTKGTWVFDNQVKEYADGDYFNITAPQKAEEKGSNIIAELDLSGQNYADMRANAKVMANAPLLLSAVERMIEMTEIWESLELNVEAMKLYKDLQQIVNDINS